MKKHLDVPIEIQKEPEHKAARHAVAKMIRNAPEEVLDAEDELQEDLLLHARSKHVFFLLDGDVDDETPEVAGRLNIVLEAPFSNELGRMLSPKEEATQRNLADDSLFAEIGAEWTEHILSKLTPEQRVSAIRHAYSCRMLLLKETSEIAGADLLSEIRRRMDAIARRCASTVARATVTEVTEEVSWPPDKPPSRLEVIETWELLAPLMKEYLKRRFPDEQQRAFIDSMPASLLDAWILTEEQHAVTVADEAMPIPDRRPIFAPKIEADGSVEATASFDGDDDEEDGGDLALGDERYGSDTRFVLSLSFKHEAHAVAKLGSSFFQRGVMRVTPDEAMYLVSMLPPTRRKVVADALVWRFIKDEGLDQATEEYGDTGVVPAWRNRTNDPALDALLVCTHLQQLYVRMLEDDGRAEHFPADPDAPKQPFGT